MSTPTNTHGSRIATLDGLRALSIALVLGAHLDGTRGYPHISRWLKPLIANGALGVSVFFVISGFLITTLLLRERAKSGTIDFKQFYLRRSLRIFPTYYVYLAVVGLLWFTGSVVMPRWELLAAATYTRNFFPHGAWYTGHAWSLAIEEQFYLLWPLVLLLAGPVRGSKIAAATIVIAPVLRLATWFALPEKRMLIDWYTFTRIDSIMFGCLLAVVRDQAWFHRASARFYAMGGAWLALLAVLGSVYLRAWTPWDVVASYSVEGLGVALLIQWCVTHAHSRVGRALEIEPLRKMGDLSYSLYVWQQLFLNRHSDFVLCRFPFNIVCAVAAALASRHLIEKPFLKLKERFGAAAAAPAPASSSGLREPGARPSLLV